MAPLARRLLGVLSVLTLSACYVEADARPPPPPPPRCARAVWVHGHRDRYGYFHPGHYRCRGARMIVVAP